MRYIPIAVALLLSTTALPADTARLGDPLDPDLEPTPIATVIEDPDSWEGKRIRIEGTVDGVCSMQGCWMDLVSSEASSLRVKVDDGVIVFPTEAIGQSAVAEGTVEIVDMDRDRYIAWMRHVADEEGKSFEPESIGDGPYRLVQLRGAGAEVDLP